MREIRETLKEAKEANIREVHFLGWDFEMGLHDLTKDIEEDFGVKPRLISIPKEALEVKDPAKEQIRFFDLNYLEVAHSVKGKTLTVAIKDFIIANPEYLPDEVRDKINLPAPRPNTFYVYAIQCDDESVYIGQTEDLGKRWQEHKAGKVDWTRAHAPRRIAHFEEYATREEAVKREHDLKTGFGRKWLKRLIASGRARQAGKFTDYIDYWAVDWDYHDDTFHNGYQSFRTRKNPKLETKAVHQYNESGRYKVLVKVVDIFGNDTTKMLPACRVGGEVRV